MNCVFWKTRTPDRRGCWGEGAQVGFDEWRGGLEKRFKTGDLAPALENHLAKYRKLSPSLALINHLADDGAGRLGRPVCFRRYRGGIF